ncbi:MAG: ornithine cyclodeaminase family protein [Candidatus Dormibacteria bacterium]
MPPIVLDDELVARRLDAGTAVTAIREALRLVERGALVAPPRVYADLGRGRLLFTAGALEGRWFGYRSYDTFDADPGEQMVVLHDWASGRVLAVAVGNELGRRRTGATGAAAVRALARADSARLGLVGSGRQAWAQLWAIRAVVRLDEVRVWSRDAHRRTAFAERAAEELGVPAHPAASAEDAVRNSDIVVLATPSPTPVIDPDWIAPGCHVNAVGPKQQGRAEFDARLAERAQLVVTDSLAQASSYEPPFVLQGTAAMGRLLSLGSVLVQPRRGRTRPDQITLFCSVGLAGTEVHLLAALVDSLSTPP